MTRHTILRILPCLALSAAIGVAASCTSMSQENEDRVREFRKLCETALSEGNEGAAASEAGIRDQETRRAEEEAAAAETVLTNDEGRYSLELRGATLASAMNMIAEIAQVNLFLDGDFSETIESTLPDVDLNKAFGLLCRTYDCTVSRDGDLIVVSRPDPDKVDTKSYQLFSISAQSVGEHLKEIVGDEGSVIVNTSNDVISVSTTTAVHRRVRGYLDSIDRGERQVLIETKILEFSLTDLFELGALLDFSNISIDDATATFVSDLLTASQDVTATVAGDKAAIEAAVNTLSKVTRVNVISHPNVMAKNNQQASIQIIEEVPYVESTVTTTGDPSTGVGTSSVESVEFKEVGIKLNVTPSIMRNGYISMAIDQDVSEQIDTFNGVPVVNHRHIITSCSVGDGRTILLGGLVKEYTFEEESGVPLLKDIPLIGALFRGTTRQKEKIELVIMITPQIVNPNSLPDLPPVYKRPFWSFDNEEEGEDVGETDAAEKEEAG